MTERSNHAARVNAGRSEVELSVSIKTILLVAVSVAVAWALASIADLLLVHFVSAFSVAVLLPAVSAMERLGRSRRLSSTVLVLGMVALIGGVVLVLAQAIGEAVRGFSADLPALVGHAADSDLGRFVNGGGDTLDMLREHAGDITKGVGKVSGGVADVGASAFGAVTLVFSVLFLTLFGLIDAPRLRDWIGRLLSPVRRSAGCGSGWPSPRSR